MNKYKTSQELDQILTKEYLVEEYTNKLIPYTIIAKNIGYSASTVKKYILKFNISIIDTYRLKLDQILTKKYLIENYINKKLSLTKIGKINHCEFYTIIDYLKKYNLPQLSKSELTKGVPKPKGFGEKISISNIGKKRTKEQNLLRSKNSPFRGKRGNNYKDGRTPLIENIRRSSKNKEWKIKVFINHNYTCQECRIRGGKLEVHHIKEFSKIFNKFINWYSKISIEKYPNILYKLAIDWGDFWDITNGKTLCRKCHDKTKKGRIC